MQVKMSKLHYNEATYRKQDFPIIPYRTKIKITNLIFYLKEQEI